MPDDEELSDSLDEELPTIDPKICELANGHTVKIAARLWPRWRTYEEWVAGIRPEPYFGIRIYCTESTVPKRLAWVEGFCEESDFAFRSFDEIWQWLSDFCSSRQIFEFDHFEEFLDHISEGILQISIDEADAVEHVRRLPQLADRNLSTG